MKKIYFVISVLAAFALSSCNSNDDILNSSSNGAEITISSDPDCCSAEEALAVQNFLHTVKPIDGLSLEIGGLYRIDVYSRTGTLHTGYNDLYFVGTKLSTGNFIKFVDITNLRPLMLMTKMNMQHSTPVSGEVTFLDTKLAAVKHGWVSFVMSSSDGGSWTLAYDAEVLKETGTLEAADISVSALSDGQNWLKSFKVGDDTYYLSLVNPTDWKTGTNKITAYVSKKNTPVTTPYVLAAEQFTIDIDPRMPDMGNHSSPGNEPLILQADGSYQGTINLTMTGLWRIFLTVKDAQGNVVAGGDIDTSTLYWDVTI